MTSGSLLRKELTPLASRLRELVGYELSPEKDYLLETRLTPVAKRFGLNDVATLLRALAGDPDPRLAQAVAEAMATHETSFFRDPPVFEALRKVVLPQLFERVSGRKVRIWSAAASTGQEAISTALLCLELLGSRAVERVEILATDFASEPLARIRAGFYSSFEVQRGMPSALLVRYFEPAGRDFRVKPMVAALIRCERHNLLDSPRHFGCFDLILLRNVLIYMDPPTRQRVLAQIHGAIFPDGWLVVGATETLTGLCDLFRPDGLGHVFYRPVCGRGS